MIAREGRIDGSELAKRGKGLELRRGRMHASIPRNADAACIIYVSVQPTPAYASHYQLFGGKRRKTKPGTGKDTNGDVLDRVCKGSIA